MEKTEDSDAQFIDAEIDVKTYATLNEAPVDTHELNTKDLEYINSSKTWKDLGVPTDFNEKLISLGFKAPSRIQAIVIRTASKSSNVLAQSQNGSGKTLAFMIPAIMSIDPKEPTKDKEGVPQPQVIILADTTALIQQLSKNCQRLVEGLYDYKIAKLWSKFTDELGEFPHIIVSTIHQIKTLVTKRQINLGSLKYLVLDECDQVMGND